VPGIGTSSIVGVWSRTLWQSSWWGQADVSSNFNPWLTSNGCTAGWSAADGRNDERIAPAHTSASAKESKNSKVAKRESSMLAYAIASFSCNLLLYMQSGCLVFGTLCRGYVDFLGETIGSNWSALRLSRLVLGLNRNAVGNPWNFQHLGLPVTNGTGCVHLKTFQ